ncbi:uncharacterized protein LOC113762072 [Coffea eugenioides]|uniref:uncharacterized protein LOC113758450 n=1 Tax=Coffea eugenioides TaxID=49369 RepID=UPI000F60F585|nr:uncharacterized protein LOC113758450 [Coffea eugenioides]XP_027161125.1 uncharacterized protein LOC113762072 [Coffea eugenioides]
MSLVDYASSSDEEEEAEAEEQEPKVSASEQPPETDTVVADDVKRRRPEATVSQIPAPSSTEDHNNRRSGSSVNQRGEEVPERLETPLLVLPDASLLLNSPALPSHMGNHSDHSSRVAAAMAESESRKRDLNGSSSSNHTRNKVPRGNLPSSRRVPDTVGGHLLPPQLAGRSNIVTEDMTKLFVKKHVNSSSE